MKYWSTKLGELNCRIWGEQNRSPAQVVVLCHGYGAPGTDLCSLGEALTELEPELASVWFVFPEAPLSLASIGLPGGRAWWSLNIQGLLLAVENGEFEDLRSATPPGLSSAREKLATTVRELLQQTGLPPEKCVIGGFSQGAMLTTDLALHFDARLAGLVVYSGMLLCQAEWTRLAQEPRLKNFPVFQSHGKYDSVLPFELAQELHQLFVNSGLQAEFLPFPSEHTIPQTALIRTAAFLSKCVYP